MEPFQGYGEIPKCDQSSESHLAVLSCGAVYNALQDSFNFLALGWNPKVKYDYSKESYWEVLPYDGVYYAVKDGSNFWVCGWNPKAWKIKWKLLSGTSVWCFYSKQQQS